MKKDIKIFDLQEQFKSISDEVNKNVTKILKSGQYILGNNVHLFEEKFAKFLNSKWKYNFIFIYSSYGCVS